MNEINEILETADAMPVMALITCVLIAGFALAGYAIHAVLSTTKDQK